MTDKQSEGRKKLSDDIETMRSKLLKLVQKHKSFVDDKIVKWQKKYTNKP